MVKTRRLSDIAAVVGGRCVGVDARFSSAVVDSRRAAPDSLFFALPGEHTDGHRYAADALARGACGVVVARAGAAGGRGAAVVVPDPGAALLEFARHERSTLDATVVGITGSVGKTSTKDFVAAVLATRLRVCASPKSFNNQIGLPLSVLGADERTQVLVCEIGAGAIGEVAELSAIARPQIGIVTVVGLAHLETFGSPQNIARAKAELVESLARDGLAILNADDPVVASFAGRTRARIMTYGIAQGADVRAAGLVLDATGKARFTLGYEEEHGPVALRVPGKHMVGNALAATACGIALGLTVAECASALGRADVSPWRMELFTNGRGVRVLNDAYNANPTSVAAALRSLPAIARKGRTIAVLGPMAQLGPASGPEHDRVGRLVARLGIDRLITVGEIARGIAESAVRCGMDRHRVSSHDDADAAIENLMSIAAPGDLVLVKGSRVAGLERLAEALR